MPFKTFCFQDVINKININVYIFLGIRKHDNGTLHHEENFEEAIRSVNFAYNQTLLPTDIQGIFKDEKLINLTSYVSRIYLYIYDNID